MINDRTATRWWQVDLTDVRPHRGLLPVPLSSDHQSIVHLDDVTGSIERFGIRQTVPAVQGDDGTPPSQAQYGAVTSYFVDGCETRLEAGLMLSARNFADEMAKHLGFTAKRRLLVSLACAAVILADVEMRLRVRSLDARKRGSDILVRDLPRTCNTLEDFVGRMINDVRRSGSSLFA